MHEVRSGALLQEWARLPYVQRARVRLLLGLLGDTLQALELTRSRELSADVIDIDQINLAMLREQIPNPERDRLYPALLELQDTREVYQNAVARIRASGGLNLKEY
ncbi:MAG: hypothetical protein M1358_11030 [Chloroflexi bacterium]|nr:hypothetical protein [Chloroflexota bacterium]